MIPTRRHVEYAAGYRTLGLMAEAAAELAWVPREDWGQPEVLSVRIELHMAKQEWAVRNGK